MECLTRPGGRRLGAGAVVGVSSYVVLFGTGPGRRQGNFSVRQVLRVVAEPAGEERANDLGGLDLGEVPDCRVPVSDMIAPFIVHGSLNRLGA